MSVNPIFTESHVQRTLHSAFIKHAHKLVVHSVYDWKRPVKEEVFDEVRIFCKEYHIRNELREFLPESLEEDRENIEKLPAFQIYVEGEYEKTAYPDNVIDILKKIVIDFDTKPPKPARWNFMFTFRFPRKNRITSHEA
jgi:hypothetical protein